MNAPTSLHVRPPHLRPIRRLINSKDLIQTARGVDAVDQFLLSQLVWGEAN